MSDAPSEHDSDGAGGELIELVRRSLPASRDARLVCAALGALADRPDGAVSVRQIAQAAGVPTGSVYVAVESKGALLDSAKVALVRAIGSEGERPVSIEEFARRLVLVFGSRGGLAKFSVERRRPMVALPVPILEALFARTVVDQADAEALSQILFALLANVRTAHPSALRSIVEDHLLDLGRAHALAELRPAREPDPRVVALTSDRPFELRHGSRWTEGLAEIVGPSGLDGVSLSHLARSVGVAVSTAYDKTSVDEVAVALHLEVFHAMTRHLDRLDDPASRLLGLHLRLNEAAVHHPWVVGILFDAQITPTADWRDPQPRPFESWVELQFRALDRLGRVREPYSRLLPAVSGLAIAPLGILVARKRFTDAQEWPAKLAAASIRPS